MDKKKEFTFDKLKLYFGEDYNINGIVIHQPTVGDILQIGEKDFYSSLNLFIINPTSIRLQLWESGIDWNKISDFQLFCMLLKDMQTNNSDLDNSPISLLFGDLNLKRFVIEPIIGDSETPEFILRNLEQDVTIDESTYLEIAQYIRTMFNIFPKEEKVKGKSTKQLIIEEEKQKLLGKENTETNTSHLLPMVSFYANHPGTKHSTKSLKSVGIYEFMDSIQQLQKYESAGAIMKGMYSGFVDATKLKPENYNFIREI